MMYRRAILLIVCFSVLFAVPAVAQQSTTPKSLGIYGVWSIYILKENDQPVCYMVAKAAVAKSKKLKRGAAWLTITHRPAENSKDVVSYTSGYNFLAGSDVTVRIGKEDFDLFTDKDTAWSRDAKTDHAFTTAVRKNAGLTITGTPAAKGAKAVTDRIDLKGADAAYHAIGRACGLEAAPKPAVPQKKKANK